MCASIINVHYQDIFCYKNVFFYDSFNQYIIFFPNGMQTPKQIQKTLGMILSDFLSDVILIFSRITRCQWKFIFGKNSSSP